MTEEVLPPEVVMGEGMGDLHPSPMKVMKRQGGMMETTNRGFPVLRFVDADGGACSIQDSSLAERDCIWLGRNDEGAVRMHLTTDMVADILGHIERDGIRDLVFDDFYGNTCVVSPIRGNEQDIHLGVTIDFEGGAQRPMRISQEQVTLLKPLLSTFVETGSIRE